MNKDSKKNKSKKSDKKLHISDVICTYCLNNKPFYMSSRSGNKVDYNPFGNKEYKQYDI
jgi:hypothetical protein